MKDSYTDKTLTWLRATVTAQAEHMRELEDHLVVARKDIANMLTVAAVPFRRCPACNRYCLQGYVCYWCGADGSESTETEVDNAD